MFPFFKWNITLRYDLKTKKYWNMFILVFLSASATVFIKWKRFCKRLQEFFLYVYTLVAIEIEWKI